MQQISIYKKRHTSICKTENMNSKRHYEQFFFLICVINILHIIMIKSIGMRHKKIQVHKFKILQSMKLTKVNKIWCLISLHSHEYHQIFIFEFKNFLFIKHKLQGIYQLGVIKSLRKFPREKLCNNCQSFACHGYRKTHWKSID